jgi:hypothetical protein
MIDTKGLVGVWYSPYLRIYSIGGEQRIAEISTYPRAYRKTVTEEYVDEVTKERRTSSYEVWAEAQDLSFTAKVSTSHQFDIVKEALTGQLVNVEILEAQVWNGKEWVKIETDLNTIAKLSDGNFSVSKVKDDPNKMLLLVRYNRKFR